MDHNNLDVIGDFIAPLSEFLDNFGITTNNNESKPVTGPVSGPNLAESLPPFIDCMDKDFSPTHFAEELK